MSNPTKVMIACAVVIGLACVGAIMAGIVPIHVFTAMLLLSTLGPIGYAGIAIPSVLFLVWHPGLYRGAERPPVRTSVLATLIGVLQIPWFVTTWNEGVEHSGFWICVAVAGANLAIAGLVFVMERRARRDPSFERNVLLHALVFGWFATFAFAYLGEIFI